MTFAGQPITIVSCPIASCPITARYPVAIGSFAIGVRLTLLLVVEILNKLGNELLEIALLCISRVQHLLIGMEMLGIIKRIIPI